MYFSVTGGDGRIIGVDNGSQTSSEMFKAEQRKAAFGKCLVVVQGHGTLTAKGYEVRSGNIQLR